MLLPLLGACAVVGPFWGSEWEPVRGLLPQDCSCRDPRCCGNLLVLCLFLIWQVRHFWYQVTRICSSKKNVNKVRLKDWMEELDAASFELTPEFFCPRHFSDLDAHIEHVVQNLRWRYQRSLQETWAQCLFCPQRLCWSSPWGACTPSEPIFGIPSLSSTCLLPQNSSREAWHVPGYLRDCQPHSALSMHQRIERLGVPSQEVLSPLEHTVSRRAGPTSMTLTISLPDLPAVSRLQVFPRESLHGPSKQHPGMLTWKAWASSQETWTTQRDTQTVGREHSGETQASGWRTQREGREIQVFEGQLPTDSGIEDSAEAKALGRRRQRLGIRETDGEILTPEWESQMGVENTARTEELGKKTQRAAGNKCPPEAQASMGENQAQLRCKADVETQTPEWGSRDKNRGAAAVETQTYDGENQKEPREEEEGEIQAQGLEKQGHHGEGNGEEALSAEQRKQNQMTSDIGAETEVKEERNKGQAGSGEAVQTQTSGGESQGVKQQNGAETQSREWGKQECVRNEKVAETQTPVQEKQGQGESKKARNTDSHRGEDQKLSKHAPQVGWENQGLGRGKDVGEPQISRKKQFREIREEDWVVIKSPWWGDQRLVVSELNRELKTPCQGNQNPAGDENRAEIQAAEESEQRKGGDEDGTNTGVPEAENKGELRGESDVETHLAGRLNKEGFGDGSGTDTQVPGKRNLSEVEGEDGAESQEVGEESQGQLGNEFHGKSYLPKWKNQEHSRGKEGANIQTSETENWEELTSATDRETQSAGWENGEQARGENGEKIQITAMRNLREAGGEAGTETGAAGEGSQSHAGCDMDRKSHLSEWKNQEQRRSEDGMEIQAPEKRRHIVAGRKDGLRTQRPERENWGGLESEIGGCCSLGRGSWEQTGGENMAENQASKKRHQKEAGSECGRRFQRLTSKKLRLLQSRVSGKGCSSEWKNQEQTGGRNGVKIQIQGEKNPRGVTSGDGAQSQAPVSGGRGQPRRRTDGETQTQRPSEQNTSGAEDAAQIWGVGSQRKCQPEDATASHALRSGDEGQVRGKGAARARLLSDCCRGEGPTGRKCSPARSTALPGFGCWALDREQAAAVNGGDPAACSEMKSCPGWGGSFLLAGGEGEHLARWGAAPASECRAAVSPASQQAPLGSQRRRPGNKRVDPAKASSLTQQPRNPQSLGVPCAFPSLPSVRVPHAAGALACAPTVPPKQPVLKKSRRLLLESLMRRRIAHLKWGLPRRILESYLLFSFLGPCSVPQPALCRDRQVQSEQKKHCRAQGSTSGLKSSKESQRVLLSEIKNSKLPTQARALEKSGPQRSARTGISTPPQKPRRAWPPGGARELQIQEANPTVRLPAPRSHSPAEPRSWCGPGSVGESSSGNSRGRTMIRPGVSEMAERDPSRARTSPSRAGRKPGKEQKTWASEALRLKSELPTCWARGSPEAVQGGEPGQQPPSCSSDTSSFKGSLYSAGARLSMTLLSKRPQPSAPNLSLRGPSVLPNVGDSHAEEGGIGVSAALKPDLQPPGLCWAGPALPRTGSRQGQGAWWSPSAAPRRFHFMKHLQRFFFQRGIKK